MMPRAWAAASASATANGNPQHLAQAHPVPRNERIQALAADVLHHDEVVAVGRLDLVNRDDVRVVEGGGGVRFLHKAAAASLRRRRGRRVGP